MVSKKIISIVASTMMFCFMVCASVTGVKADDSEVKVVDGSYLTSADSSTGYTPKSDERGKHLMDGECSITKAGTKRIYTYGATTANHTVDTVAVIVYVDQYSEKDDEWYQIDAFSKKVENDYYVAASKSIQVDRGYYYRVHAEHFVRMGEEPVEETYSYTNGILVPYASFSHTNGRRCSPWAGLTAAARWFARILTNQILIDKSESLVP